MGTFFICLFIFMMQFLWKYVDEMVGKGLEMSVLAQFFFYSALTLVPASLPLAILLAALITFGNFGERFEPRRIRRIKRQSIIIGKNRISHRHPRTAIVECIYPLLRQSTFAYH